MRRRTRKRKMDEEEDNREKHIVAVESCNAVDKEIIAVMSKFGAIKQRSSKVLSETALHLDTVLNEIKELPSDTKLTSAQTVRLLEVLSNSKEAMQHLTSDHRDLHGAVSKVGKAIDRNFTSDFSATIREDIFADLSNLEQLNRIIVEHFYHHGMEDVAATLITESGTESVDDSKPEPFNELHNIMKSLRSQRIQPALTWAQAHSIGLEARGSSLEFKLHRLAFLQVIETGVSRQGDAITYARVYFKKFVKRFEKEIQVLMGMLMYLPQGLKKSPYGHLMVPELWIEIADLFIRDACTLLGLSMDSPLTLSVNAGCTALPALLNIKQVMQSRQVNIWKERDELPIEIDLGTENRYHSVFACPILRQQSTEENPPMKLVCGHVISRDALNKLCNGPKMKCPYCPMEQAPSEARLVYF